MRKRMDCQANGLLIGAILIMLQYAKAYGLPAASWDTIICSQ